jgi:rhamnulokinase
MSGRVYLAVDLGAESGRVMAGIWNGRTLGIQEVHRFSNGPVRIADSLRWDVLRLWSEIQSGLRRAAEQHGDRISSVGVDSWGVDFVLLSSHDEILGQPYHYRDDRNRGMMAKAFQRVPRAEIFSQTGLQFMEINTLYQLLAIQEKTPELFDSAKCLLMIPDFFHWCLCGSRVVEFTNGTTSQCLHPLRRDWATEMLTRLCLPAEIFPKIVTPGERLGTLRPSVSEATRLGNLPVIAPPTHDTASAVAGAPSANTGKTNWAYVSSGTWSLIGVETLEASLSKRTLELNLTNEGGLDGTYRLLKNVMGLWLVQQCKWSLDAMGKTHSYPELETSAANAAPLRCFVDPDDDRFLNPADMPAAIRGFCRETGQPVPESEGELIRCALESLALKYRVVLGWLEELTGNRIEVIHIIGGGSQNRLLNQMTADACRRRVITGPVEATAFGNLLVQARASGELGSLGEMREVVRRSCKVDRYEPACSSQWQEAADRFEELLARRP